MSDEDEKTEARGGAQRGAEDRYKRGQASGVSPHDGVPARNTAPAGTPAHKVPAALPLSEPISAPEQLGPPPVVKSSSERPPAVETMSPARTVGGQTARLKAPEEERARGRERKGKPIPRLGPADDDDDEETLAKPPASARGGAKSSRRGAGVISPRSGKEGRQSWDADTKDSEPEATNAGVRAAPAAPAAVVESRWPFAVAVGAVAFAIGSILPLPFRKYIVGSPEAAPSSIPLSTAPRSSAAPSTAAPAAVTGAPTGAVATATAAPPSETGTAKADASATASAAPSASASAGKRPGGKGGKGGHIGDIF